MIACLGMTGCIQYLSAEQNDNAAGISIGGSLEAGLPDQSGFTRTQDDDDAGVSVSSSDAASASEDGKDFVQAAPTADVKVIVKKAEAVAVQTAVIAVPTAVPTVKPTAAPVTKTALPTPAPAAKTSATSTSKIVLNTLLGQTEAQVTAVYGQPGAKELSEYGFTWYVYNSNYKRFLMVGISSGKVVGVYSNSAYLSFANQTTGKTRAAVRTALAPLYGNPLTAIAKGNARYLISKTDQKDVLYNGNCYATIYYDNIQGGTLTAVQVIAKTTELSIGYFGQPGAALSASYERISFYLVNAIRSRRGLALMAWDNKLAAVARAHSKDMYVRNYFSHTNPDGLNASARIRAAGISYANYGENIAKNYPSAISAHEGLMNSQGHRDNILRNCTRLGVGVYMDKNGVLITQDSVTYK